MNEESTQFGHAERVRNVLHQYWGFDQLRPLQGESIAATLAGKDSVTILPTGGGKSLCFQVPALVSGKLTLVVSPLIALMQDQVAGLKLAGVPAAALHGNMSPEERGEVRDDLRNGKLKLLLAAPERILMPDFLSFVSRLNIGHIAIDESHCISQWGHDFRPEYRRLRELRDVLPRIAMGAYTATATPRVKHDIVEQLGLRDPAIFVGSFDRPNLTYRAVPRMSAVKQVIEALQRHEGRAAIVYCISRRDTEEMAAALKAAKIHAAAYHAGLKPEQRSKVSDHFKSERLDVVCATVAFGMGIDRGDVRCVVHAAMPKSIEHYQQETGRAGRDGLPAECLLLYSSADFQKWKMLMERGAEESEAEDAKEMLPGQLALLTQIQRFASSMTCRHRALTEYFGQEYTKGLCGACDCCLAELEPIADAQDTARKIISCVVRVGQSFGAAHVADVLLGSKAAPIVNRGHHELSTHGLLKGMRRDLVLSCINQLVDSGDLVRSEGQYPILQMGHAAQEVLRNERMISLVKPKSVSATEQRKIESKVEAAPLTDAERGLFEALRVLRREIADERKLPAFLIFSDATLEEISRMRPGSTEKLMLVHGVGVKKAADFGRRMVECVVEYCRGNGMVLDPSVAASRAAPTVAVKTFFKHEQVRGRRR